MIDGGSNVCVTGNLESLLDVVDIEPITILVALKVKGAPESYNNCITKQGLLPLSLSIFSGQSSQMNVPPPPIGLYEAFYCK
jgi:hypothetical protein